MSWDLVHRGLELFDTDLAENSSWKANGSAKPVNVSTNRHGIKKAAKQKQKAQTRRREVKAQLIQKQVTNAIAEYEKYTKIDCTNDNIKLLKKIDRKKAPTQYIEQVVNHHAKELERKGGVRDFDHQKKGKKRDMEETSVFTDEDFEKMNEEWLRLY